MFDIEQLPSPDKYDTVDLITSIALVVLLVIAAVARMMM
jgi:hypothetical protein